MKEEGIFRVSGQAKYIIELKGKINNLEQAAWWKDSPDIMSQDINVITGLVKLWLRELPEPLLTFSLYKEYMSLSESDEEDHLLVCTACSVVMMTDFLSLSLSLSSLSSPTFLSPSPAFNSTFIYR